MSEARAWVLMLAFLAWGGYAVTEILALTSPHMTVRQRWAVVFWLLVVAGSANLAWEAGE